MRRRWHGDPAEAEQPDVGDVIAHVATRGPDAGMYAGGAIYRVLAARPVRGREDEPSELVLDVERGTAADLWPAGEGVTGGGRAFTAHPCRGRDRCPYCGAR